VRGKEGGKVRVVELLTFVNPAELKATQEISL
jgi:hypothetical protein